jgi:hypothetical protein
MKVREILQSAVSTPTAWRVYIHMRQARAPQNVIAIYLQNQDEFWEFAPKMQKLVSAAEGRHRAMSADTGCLIWRTTPLKVPNDLYTSHRTGELRKLLAGLQAASTADRIQTPPFQLYDIAKYGGPNGK